MNQMTQAVKMPMTVWTNGKVSLGKDLVFGVVVLTEETGWEPLFWLPPDTVLEVQKLVDFDKSCPFLKEIDEQVAHNARAN